MNFTEIPFLFLFLPIALFLYYICPKKIRIFILLVISLIFYSIGSGKYFILLAISLFVNILLSMFISKQQKTAKKLLLILGILYNIGILGYYKYYDFFITNVNTVLKSNYKLHDLALPLGLSFFTFKSISYLVDVYNGKSDYSIIKTALYLSFFGQIQSGPLSRYEDMGFSFTNNNASGKEYFNSFSDGVYRFIIGFSKKVLLANILEHITSEVFSSNLSNVSTSYLWLGSICWSLQLYYDFSGYSDMAIGISQMFGLRCPENFNYPYTTKSVSEFWRRWHITLGAWYRDYIYIPMGGSRAKNKGRLIFNLFTVWFLTGLWHGANWTFIIWGILYFIIISVEKLFNLPTRFKSSICRALYRLLTLLFINFQWVIFRAPTLKYAMSYIKKMILFTNNTVSNTRTLFLIKDNFIFIIFAIIFSIPIGDLLKNKIYKSKRSSLYSITDTLTVIIIFLLLILSVSFVVSGMNNPFEYANF
ncbi:MAG: MBOAT family protein [Lachnospiraceae bacterium]|nr:MBOAT family protein [Lachnospiraceae bacterium]